MDQNEAHNVSTDTVIDSAVQMEIEKVIEIIERATSTAIPISAQKEEHSGAWRSIVNFIEMHKKKVSWAAFAFSLLLGGVVLLQDILPKQALFPMALVIGSLVELCCLSILLSEILVAVPTLYQLKKKPFKFFFTQLRTTTAFDLLMISELARCDPAAVRYVTKHYQYHRVGLEKRGGTLSGNIDKLGLFPTIGAVVLLWGQLSTSPIGSWAVMLVPIILIFHIINLYSFGLQQRMDRVIAGLEFSVASSKT